MRNKIGEEAGKIWHMLGAKDEVDMTMLPKALKGKGEIIYQALGWLAHEDKIIYHVKAGKTYISLNDKEKAAYKRENQMPASGEKMLSEKPISEKSVSEKRVTDKQASMRG